jgi:hypothetical protein
MRRVFLILFALPFVFAISGVAQERQIDWDKVQVKVQKISANVYLLQGLGGNIGAFVSVLSAYKDRRFAHKISISPTIYTFNVWLW